MAASTAAHRFAAIFETKYFQFSTKLFSDLKTGERKLTVDAEVAFPVAVW